MPTGAIPFPFGRCRICVDKATGIHYGVATCEGCKGFFKRSITKAEKYRCFFGGSCTLTPKNRNRCKSCRFKRCMETGMALDAVKMGRIPKVEKERALEEEKEKWFEDGKDSEPVYDNLNSIGNMSGSSSGVSSEERSPPDSTVKDLENVTQSKGFNSSEKWTPSLNFPQYPLSERNYGPGLPQLGNEYQDHRNLIHNQVKSGEPVPMESSSSNLDVPVSRLNETKVGDPNPSDFSTKPLVSGQNVVKVEDSVPRSGIAVYPDPGEMVTIGKPIPRDHSVKSFVPVHIGMKFGENDMRKLTDLSPVPQISVSLGNRPNPVAAMTPQPEEQHCTMSMNGPASCNTRNQNVNERKAGMRSPGMTPSSVYNAEVVKQLFTHALENICQDGRKVQLIEKFLHSSDSTTANGGASCQNVCAVAISSATPGREEHSGQDMMKPTVAIPLHARTSLNVDEAQKRKTEKKTDLGPKHKFVRTNPTTLNVNGALFSGSRGGERRQPIPNQSGLYGMHKLPPTLPQLAAVMRPSHNTIPSTQFSAQGISSFPVSRQPMELGPSNWYDRLSDSFFDDRNMANIPNFQKQSTENTLTQQPNTLTQQPNTLTQQPNTCPQIIKIKQEPQTDFQTADCPFRNNGQMPPNSNSVTSYRHPQNGQFLKRETNFQANSYADTAQRNNCSDIKPDFCNNDDIQIIESIFSDFATSTQTAEVPQNGNNPTLSPNTDDWFPLDDINVEVLDDENLCGDELVHHLQKWYEKIETSSLSMIKALHDGLKAGTHLDLVIPLDSPRPKRTDAQHIWQLLFSNVEPCSVRVANFCRIIPGFSLLASEDKDTLVTSAFFDLWMICHSALFFDDEVHILFPQNVKLKYCRYWMKQFLPEELIKKFFNFCDVFNSCNLTTGEVAVIMAVRATLPERPGLKDVGTVKKVNMRYLNVMVQTIITNHADEGGNILKKLFMILPLLNDINEHQNQVIGSFRIDQLPCQDDEQQS